MDPILDPWLPPGSNSLPLYLPATIFEVYRVATANSGDVENGRFLLDNVLFHYCEQHMGDDPGVAAFSYAFSDNGDASAPQTFEDALNPQVVLPKTVATNDRLQVVAYRPDGVSIIVFDGYVLEFGLSLAEQTENVDFYAVGVAKTLWDTPIGGQYLRSASDTLKGTCQETDILAQFNPRIRGKTYGNASPDGGDRFVGGSPDPDQQQFGFPSTTNQYPVFLDPLLPSSVNGNAGPREWNLEMVARYLIWHHNADQELVDNPTTDDIKGLLVSREPIPNTPYDPGNPASFTTSPIMAPNKPVTGRAWPQVLHEFLRNAGFGMTFRTETLEDDSARSRLDMFVLQAGPLKDISLQPRGNTLDPRYSNVPAATISRDMRQVVNQWSVYGALTRYEVSLVLAPRFLMVAADGTDAGRLANLDINSSTYVNGQRDLYRLYVFDETGEGWVTLGTSDSTVGQPTDLSQLFGTKDYAVRRRPPRGELISTDSTNVPYRAQLAFSTDYTGPYPAVWNGTGTWTTITEGWKLCDDRCGIRIDCEHPNSWAIGKNAAGQDVVLKGVESQCKPNAPGQFYLRLTCVIESDTAVSGTAEPTGSSPLVDTITRTVDARDRFVKEVIAPHSLFNAGATAKSGRDDSSLAMADAVQARAATEAGVLNGRILIPYPTTYYEIGDRIGQINGRGVSFRTDSGAPGETAVYPLVEGRRISNYPEQSTTLIISDESQARHQLERKIRR